jgi:hypothetical protein
VYLIGALQGLKSLITQVVEPVSNRDKSALAQRPLANIRGGFFSRSSGVNGIMVMYIPIVRLLLRGTPTRALLIMHFF